MTRAFVAVSLPDAVLEAVARRTANLAVPGRRTTRDQWHVTLQFLGNDADVDAVAAALAGLEAAGGPARVGGAGAFPVARRARVLWLGLVEGVAMTTRLADAVAARTAAIGYEREHQRFDPHLTLARYREPTDARDTIASIGHDPVGPAWHVDAVTVYESQTLPDGARYVERATIPLPR